MTSGPIRTNISVSCEACPLRKLKVFRPFAEPELAFVSGFKTGELRAAAGTTVLLAGNNSAHLYTLLAGWMFRHKTLQDGRRQILNFALPGDFVGLQSSVFGEMQHSVETLTDVVLCVFERKRLWECYKDHPGLAFDLTWLAAREEGTVDEHLLSVGRRTAIERTAYILLYLFRRARELGLTQDNMLSLPVTQQHLADMLGMSLVHTNKTLKRLYDRKVIRWKDRNLTVLNMKELTAVARDEEHPIPIRPLI